MVMNQVIHPGVNPIALFAVGIITLAVVIYFVLRNNAKDNG